MSLMNCLESPSDTKHLGSSYSGILEQTLTLRGICLVFQVSFSVSLRVVLGLNIHSKSNVALNEKYLRCGIVKPSSLSS